MLALFPISFVVLKMSFPHDHLVLVTDATSTGVGTILELSVFLEDL